MFCPNARLLLNAANLAVGASQPWPLHIDKPKKKRENKKPGVNLHLLTCLRVIIKMYIKKTLTTTTLKLLYIFQTTIAISLVCLL